MNRCSPAIAWVKIFSMICADMFYGLNAEASQRTYTLHFTERNWTAAKQTCEAESKQLLTMNSKSDYGSFLLTLKPTRLNHWILIKQFWFGLSTETNNCTLYSWNGGDILGNYSVWDRRDSEPNDCMVDKCVRVDHLLWWTTSCQKKLRFICENKCNSNLMKLECSYSDNAVNNSAADQDLEQKIKKLREDLTVPKHSTQCYRRRKISVYEERASAKAMGMMGMAIVIGVVSLVVLSDVIKLINYITDFCCH